MEKFPPPKNSPEKLDEFISPRDMLVTTTTNPTENIQEYTNNHREGLEKAKELINALIFREIDPSFFHKIQQDFEVTDDEVNQIAHDVLVEELGRDYDKFMLYRLTRTLKLKERFEISDSVAQKAVIEHISSAINCFHEKETAKICGAFNLDLHDPRVQDEVIKGANEAISRRGILKHVIETMELFGISEDRYLLEMRDSAIQGAIVALSETRLDDFLAIKKFFKLPEQELSRNDVKNILRDSIEKSFLYDGKKNSGVYDETLFSELYRDFSPIVAEAVNHAFVRRISKGELSEVISLLQEFSSAISLSREEIALNIARVPVQEYVRHELRKREEYYYDNEERGEISTIESSELRQLFELFPEAREKMSDGAKAEYNNALQKGGFLEMKIIDDQYSIDPKLKQLTEVFGEHLTISLYRVGSEVLDGNISEDARAIGVTEAGPTGVVQLAEQAQSVIHSYLAPQEELNGRIPSAQQLLESPFLADMFKYAVHYEQSEWGDHDESSFKKTLQNYEEARKNEEIDPLSWYITPSEAVQIPLRERVRVPLSESAINRYETLKESLRDAFHRLESSKKPLSEIALLLEDNAKQIIADLEARRNTVEREEARIGIDRRIEQIKNIDFRSVKNFQETIRILGQFPELQDTMREAIFLYALARHREIRDRIRNITEQNVSPQTISDLLEFVEHIVNQETFSEYFTDKKSADFFRKITSVKSFEEELQRIQKMESSSNETVPIKFIPTRGLLAEFSGHIADACWASKYDSVLKEAPMVSHVMLVKNPDDPKSKKIIGACLLIETLSDAGDHLLVVRGLNPQESEINKLHIPAFYEAFTSWVKECADEDSRIPAIVIDDHAGGAATNRPKLFAHLSNITQNMEHIRLDPKRQHEGSGGWVFNGYDQIDTDCFKIK